MSMNALLFIGIESFTWSDIDFAKAIDLCKQYQLDGLMVKVFDGMQGEWYNGRFPAIYMSIKSAGLICVPYGFHYGYNKGSDLVGEAKLAIKYGQTYGKYCADMESSWDGQGDWAGQLAGLIQAAQAVTPFEFWVSTWANVGDEAGGHSWLTNISHLAPVTKYFMPQAYSDSLYSLMIQDWSQSAASKTQIQPTFALSQEFGVNNPVASYQAFAKDYSPQVISLWEYGGVSQFQSATSALIQTIKSILGGTIPVPIILSSAGCVCDIAPSNQLDNAQGESQDMCGPWTVAGLKYAGLPGKGALASGAGHENPIDDWAETEYEKYIGPNTISNQAGSSIENMHQFFHDAGNLHYWDIGAISPSSAQSSDLANIRRAVQAGYPVVVTASEPSIHSKRLGKNPYPWQPALGAVNHIFAVVGIDKDGDFIVADQLNSFEPWPQTYLAAPIDCSWASIVQLVGPDPTNPWLKPIPSGDSTTWPNDFNAQNFGQPQPPPPNTFPQEAQDCWNSFLVGVLGKTPAPFTTGIAHAWTAAWLTGKQFGPPLTYEYHSKDNQNRDIIVQEFAHARCEWTGTATFYSFSGKI